VPSPPTDKGNRRILQIASRTAAAILCGYVLASLSAAALPLVLPGDRADAVLISTMLSFVIYVFAALWAFAARSGKLAWLGLAPGSIIAIAILILHKGAM
jgi:hypothetical protein